MVNGRISESSYQGYRRFRGFLPEFDLIQLFAVQTEEYARRLRNLGVGRERIHVSGNLKYDNLRLASDPDREGEVRRLLNLEESCRILVAGSTHPGEEELLLEVFASLKGAITGLRLVIAPRHVERAPEVLRHAERRGIEAVIWTDVRAGRSIVHPDHVLLIDTIGELETFYGVAEVVFVGGSMVPHGGQNILEPAGLGRPVVFGPHMDNFRQEVRLLLGQDAAVQVRDVHHLGRVLREMFDDPKLARQMGARAREAVIGMRGTTAQSLDLILAHLT